MSAFQTFCLSPSAATPPAPEVQWGSSRATWKHRTTAFVLPKGKSLIAHQDRNCPFQQTSIENHKMWNYSSNSKSRNLLDVHGLSPAFMRSGGIEKVARDLRKTSQEGKIT